MSLFELPEIGRYTGPKPQSTPPSYDADKAALNRDNGIERAEGGAEALKSHRAYEALKRVAERQQTFIVDDVQQEWGESFAEGRAMGAVTLRGIREGIIEGTNEYRPSARENCHKNPRRVFKSLIYKGGGE